MSGSQDTDRRRFEVAVSFLLSGIYHRDACADCV